MTSDVVTFFKSVSLINLGHQNWYKLLVPIFHNFEFQKWIVWQCLILEKVRNWLIVGIIWQYRWSSKKNMRRYLRRNWYGIWLRRVFRTMFQNLQSDWLLKPFSYLKRDGMMRLWVKFERVIKMIFQKYFQIWILLNWHGM